MHHSFRPFRIVATIACMACCLMIVNSAQAQQPDPSKQRLEDSPRHHDWVEIKAGERTVRAFLVFPQVDKPAPAVIVIHENRGLTDWVRGVADQLAERGFVAIAPDLLSQTGPGGGNTDAYESQDKAREGIGNLPPEQVTADLDATFEFISKQEAANGKVAVIGFCWGGGQTFRYATHNDKVAAACVFYGAAPTDEAVYEKITAPVYGFYGENDFRITGQVRKVADLMKNANKTFDTVTYEKAGHGFMRAAEAPDGPPADQKAREAAWVRLTEIINKL